MKNDRQSYGTKRLMGYVAVALALAMVITGFSLHGTWQPNQLVAQYAKAETKAEDNTGTGMEKVESPFERVYEQVSDAVVGVNVVTNTSIQRGRINTQSQLSGSGVVVKEGYVLTNFHVVDGGRSFTVTAGDKEYSAEYVGGDESSDLAILKVNDLDIQPVVLGDSDALKVGEWALVIGTPLSTRFANTLTVGIISGLDRKVQTINERTRTYSNNTMIQVDAAINSGNSGGALFNTRGELIGIPSMKMSNSGFYGSASIEGIGMAIPINTAKPILEDLIQYKKVLRPRLGVVVATMDSPAEEPTEDMLPASILITEVQKDSPAEEAGLKPYDLIMKADGKRIYTTTELTEAIRAHKVGETMTLSVYRISNLSSLKGTDKIPDGEYMDIIVDIRILEEDLKS